MAINMAVDVWYCIRHCHVRSGAIDSMVFDGDCTPYSSSMDTEYSTAVFVLSGCLVFRGGIGSGWLLAIRSLNDTWILPACPKVLLFHVSYGVHNSALDLSTTITLSENGYVRLSRPVRHPSVVSGFRVLFDWSGQANRRSVVKQSSK